MRRLVPVILLVLLITPWQAGSQAPPSTRHVRFTTHEGSWLSFDVSRDGRWIAFDLLGQIWQLPIDGGIARAVTDVVRDSAEFLDPNFAPDGRSIIAHGEYRGRSGVFIISISGRSVRWVAPDSLERLERIHSPSWGRDAEHILLARGDPSASGDAAQPMGVIDRDTRTGEEHAIEISGVPLPGREGLIYSAGASEIVFNTRASVDVFPDAGRIWRVPAAGGVGRPVTPAGLMARAASPSPDGRRLAYFVMDSTSHAQVWIQNVVDSIATRLTDDRDVTPIRIRWLPDNQTIVYVANGRLWKLNVDSRARREIAFSATVDFERKVAKLPPVRFPSPGDQVASRGSRGFALAPGGRSFAMIALNGLWVVRVNPSIGAPRKLVSLPPGAANPTWSPDGNRIVWQGGRFGAEDLFVTDTLTRRTRRLTSLRGMEVAPSWSPDGRYIAFTHITRDTSGRIDMRLRALRATDSIVSSNTETIDLGPAPPPQVSSPPRWNPTSDAVMMLGPQQDLRQRIASLRPIDGAPRRPLKGLPYDATYAVWLPGDTIVFLAAARMWRAPIDARNAVVGTATPVSDEPAAYLNASPSGELMYVSEDGFRIRSRSRPPRHIGWPIRYTVPTPPPVLVRNVRIIDGTGAPATTPRDILVERGRFRQIAPVGTISVPATATIVDAGGRIAIPGLIDLHSHHGGPAQLRGQLYFGVTTTRTLGGIQAAIVQRDAVAAGEWPGPRAVLAPSRFYTDDPFTTFGNVGLNPEADPHHLDRGIELVTGFAGDWVKIYANAHFATQVRVAIAAHSIGRRVTGHCAYPLALIAAGIDAKEHLGWQCTLHDGAAWYDDLIQLYAHAGVAVVPTLALFNTLEPLHGTRTLPPELAAMFGEELPQVVGSIALKPWGSAWSVNTANAMDAARKLHRAGVAVATGTDFETPDGEHYELQSLVNASFSPLEAIAAATSVAARVIGASGDVGRIAPGLLADLVILDADPTNDIRNTRQIWRVIQGGRIVDRQQLTAPGWDTTDLP
jgi:Tol biopolymer transport system component